MSHPTTITASYCRELDANDPFAALRDQFALPADTIYLDGNSLGAMPASIPARIQQVLEQEWAQGLIRSWNDAHWYPAPQRTAAKIATLIGAKPTEVIVADSTSINLFKVLVAGKRLRPERPVILAERGNFPTDAYIASSVSELMHCDIRYVEADEVLDALTEQVAILSLTHVNYKSGRRYDMAEITRRAHEKGILVVWDLCHSAGAMPVELNTCQVDFAVGCGYKYLNGGPGAPAFVYVAERHIPQIRQPLTGWHGHEKPFDFTHDYHPHPTIDRMLTGTAPQLGVLALEEALKVFDGLDLYALRRKSSALGDLFIALCDQELQGLGVELRSPREAEQRGSQVALGHPEAFAVMQALIARNIIGDFRAPDILRFGFAPLYISYQDIWHSVAALRDILQTAEWDRPEFKARKAVT